MTVRELASAMLRRWYVVLVVVALAAAGGWFLHRNAGVYTTQTIVSFMLPDKTALSPNSGLDDASVIAFAGTVAQEVNNGKAPTRYSTDDAPFYGAGVRKGVLVTIPNAGNQWVSSYLRAEVELQIVGPTREWVAATQAETLQKVTQIAQAQQVGVVAEDSRIQTSVVPLTLRIFHIVPSRSAEIAALVALAAAALITGGWGAATVDRTVLKRKRRSASRFSASSEGLLT